jgi:hypothetical protein
MLLLSLISFATLAFALPNGSPLCDISAQAIANAHGESTPETGYSLVLSSTDASSPITVTIANSKGLADFAGILLYAEEEGKAPHLGSFSGFAPSFREQGSCGGDESSTLTHASGNPNHPLATTSFTWTYSGPTATGKVVFRAVVATGEPGEPYQIIESEALSFASYTVAPTRAVQAAIPAPAPLTAPAPSASTASAPAASAPPAGNTYTAPAPKSETKSTGACSPASLKRRSLIHERFLSHVLLKHGGDASLHKRSLKSRQRLAKRALKNKIRKRSLLAAAHAVVA